MALAITVLATAALSGAGAAQAAPDLGSLRRGLDELVSAHRGPRGVIATVYRDRHLTVISAGRASVDHPGAPRPSEHMRIASVSKTFNGAVVLHLVQRGLIGLDDTIGWRLPSLPVAWHAVTVAQMLDHTSGLPDYTKSDGFIRQLTRDPQEYVAPATIIGWVRSDGLQFAPGSRYEYSNTDNIVLGLIAEQVTGMSYGSLLRQIVFDPARLHQTSFPSAVALPNPFIHGYGFEKDGSVADVTTSLSPSGAWASGAIVSTPDDLNSFIRHLLGRTFFDAQLQRAQLHFVSGESSPAGPGVNAAGLGIFRYATRCGTVYGHTGNFPGYTQFAAATRDGRRGVTVSLNIAAPTGALLEHLQSVESTAVCALLGKEHP